MQTLGWRNNGLRKAKLGLPRIPPIGLTEVQKRHWYVGYDSFLKKP